MKYMFTSARLKLTAWYLIILVVISVLFSFIIFELSTSEINNRLERLQIRAEGSNRTITLPGPLTLTEIRESQTQEARMSILLGLIYMNLAVVGLGGVGSFLLARATIRPIEAAHESQSRFTADASHELRTPLAVMKSEIQVALKDEKMNEHDYKLLLKSNLEEVDRMTDLSESLLQLSKLERTSLERFDAVNITESIQVAAQSLTIPLCRLFLQSPKNNLTVDGSQSLITDLFRIILDNAVKYSTINSRIEVNVESNGRMCTISISNDGPGIEPDELSKIFERFYRIEKSRSSATTQPGYGLGLSLAKTIVDIHDGTIQATSTPGVSTTFTIELPHIHKNR